MSMAPLLVNSCDVDEKTGCLLWMRGPVSSDGIPVHHVGGRQRTVHRALFGAYFKLDVPRWLRLRRVCSASRCVSPLHHVVASPGRVARRLGRTRADLRVVADVLRLRAALGPPARFGWTWPMLLCDPAHVADFAAALDVDELLVLAAHALLIADAGAREHATTTA